MNIVSLNRNTNIEDALSVRSLNMIKNINHLMGEREYRIETLGDLGNFSELEIALLKKSGVATTQEIKDVLHRAGLSLSNTSDRLNNTKWRHVFNHNKPFIIHKYKTASV